MFLIIKPNKKFDLESNNDLNSFANKPIMTIKIYLISKLNSNKKRIPIKKKERHVKHAKIIINKSFKLYFFLMKKVFLKRPMSN